MKKPPKDDLYIAMLRYGKAHLNEHVTYLEVEQHLERQGHDIARNHFVKVFAEAFDAEGEEYLKPPPQCWLI